MTAVGVGQGAAVVEGQAHKKGADNNQQEQIQQLMDTEEDRSLRLFAGETYNCLNKAV